MKTLVRILTLSLIGIIAISCNKNKDPEPGNKSNTTTTPPPPANQLCDGDGSSTFFPMVLTDGNAFEFEGSFEHFTHTVNGTSTIDGKVYFVVTGNSNIMGSLSNDYYRIDNATGDIYIIDGGYPVFVEDLDIKGNPQVGDYWISNNAIIGDSSVVVATDATLTTSDCSYTDLIKIDVWEHSSASTPWLYKTKYYKKGLGLVKDGVYTLSSVTLN